MKKNVFILLTAALACGLCGDSHAQKRAIETVVFVTSIHCENCKKRVEDNIPFEKGVKDVKVDMATKKVAIEFDPAKTNVATLRKAIEKLGYKAEEEPQSTEKTDTLHPTGK